MRIGIDCRMYSSKFTGIGRYTFELVRNLAEIDQQNEFILFFNAPEYEQFETPSKNFKKILINSPHYSLKEQTKFLYHLLKQKLDLMHFTHFNAPIFYMRPSLVTIHDLTLSFFPGNKMRSPLHRAAYHITLRSATKKAKKIIAVSQYTKKDLEKLLHINSEKIHVIYEAVNDDLKKIENKKEIKKALQKFSIKKPYILYTGVWRNHKNLVNLIKAFAKLRSYYNLDYELVITGKEDPKYPEIKEAIEHARMTERTCLTGLVSEKELQILYSAAHAYCLPSLYEGFGLSPLEAMKCGAPVAVSKLTCLMEICGEENALFFDPYDVNDIAEKLATICTNTAVRNQLIENGKKHIEKFSWKKMARETLALYNEILSRKSHIRSANSAQQQHVNGQ